MKNQEETWEFLQEKLIWRAQICDNGQQSSVKMVKSEFEGISKKKYQKSYLSPESYNSNDSE